MASSDRTLKESVRPPIVNVYARKSIVSPPIVNVYKRRGERGNLVKIG